MRRATAALDAPCREGPQRGVAFGHHDDSASAIGRVRFGRRTCRLDRRRSVFVRGLDSARRACPTFVDRSIRSFAGASVEHVRTGRLSMVECLRRGGAKPSIHPAIAYRAGRDRGLSKPIPPRSGTQTGFRAGFNRVGRCRRTMAPAPFFASGKSNPAPAGGPGRFGFEVRNRSVRGSAPPAAVQAEQSAGGKAHRPGQGNGGSAPCGNRD